MTKTQIQNRIVKVLSTMSAFPHPNAYHEIQDIQSIAESLWDLMMSLDKSLSHLENKDNEVREIVVLIRDRMARSFREPDLFKKKEVTKVESLIDYAMKKMKKELE
jgi:hypothetical protein